MQITTIAQSGLTRAFDRFAQSAERTARVADPEADVDIASEVVEQVQAKYAVQANVAVLRTADEMLGALLDIKI